MESNQDNFLNQVDELIRLFKILHEKAKKEGVIVDNDPMIKNFENLRESFKMIKNSMPPEMANEIAGPIKGMVNEMINQIKEDLGENINNPENNDISSSIEKIDSMLSSDNLSEAEINKLLDNRLKN